jgi:beta-galactosidase
MEGFPTDFVWGTATAAYQIEGAVNEDGRGPSIWDTFSHTPGKISDGSTGDVADDHYHRYPEDVSIMAGLGMSAYRFSIAWPRIFPTGSGRLNQPGLDFYRQLAEACSNRGITPYATLYHWDLPQPLEDAGGWLNRDTAERFRDYAAATQQALGDVISHWITLNEPWCSAFLGYAVGVHAPGKTLGAEAMHAVHHLLLAHGLAISAMREGPAGTLGITLNLSSVRAASDSAGDQEAARRMDGLSNRLFLDPVLLGRYPDDVLNNAGVTGWFEGRADDLETVATPIDFMGVNYYTRHTVAGPADGVFRRPTIIGPGGTGEIRTIETGAPKTQMDWEVHPDGLIDVVQLVADRAPALPVYITENGAAYPDQVTAEGAIEDEHRRRYFELHLNAGRLAIEQGLPLRGYFAWSLLDNFEWAFGYSRRFGIVYVDYETQQRIVKRSGHWFRTQLQGAAHRSPS